MTPHIFRREVLLGLVAAVAARPVRAAVRSRVVASFSILADIVGKIADGRVEVSSLVGPDADAHVFEPSGADVRMVAQAALVAVNGLGFEGWLDRLVGATARRDRPIIASAGVQPIQSGGAPDPHAWHDPRNGVIYANNIARALSTIDPAGKPVYVANASRLTIALRRLDVQLRHSFSTLPTDRRAVLTSHDAFAYFGRAYGVKFIAVEGMSTKDEVSARHLATIISQVRAGKIGALFIENATDHRLMGEISRETGAKIGGRLYADALSARGGPASTYIALLSHNAGEILSALAVR